MAPRDRQDNLSANAAQRKALSSPIRLEIIGQFTSPGGMSIAEVADRMGRPATSLYYHFRMLEQAGLLRRIGSRPRVKRGETVYEPVAHRFTLEHGGAPSDLDAVLKTMAAAFRMAQRDLDAALTSGSGRTEGNDRNFFAARVHFRTTKNTLGEINEHLRAIEAILMKEAQQETISPDADQYCSLTLALLPLRGRETR